MSEWEDERDAGSLGMGGVDESEQLGDRRTGGYEERMRRDGHCGTYSKKAVTTASEALQVNRDGN